MVVEEIIRGGWRHLAFAPLREGVEICRLIETGATPASVALLRYRAGAMVPRHRHPGLETVLVLEGAQSDEKGTYPAGSLVINPAGSIHSVWSERGCVVLIHWERPVEFLEEGT
jgi:anti-sigma factor ChrR (cupin superfamily)